MQLTAVDDHIGLCCCEFGDVLTFFKACSWFYGEWFIDACYSKIENCFSIQFIIDMPSNSNFNMN